MTNNVFRPFWNYDVQETEKWLSSMAAKGFHLHKITGTSIFVFMAEEPKSLTYFISYEKRQGDSLPPALQNDGWTRIFGNGKWHVIANEKPVEQIKTYPLRDDLLTRNSIIMYISGFFAVTHFSLFFVLSLILYLFTDLPVTFVPSPFWTVTVIFYALVYYSFIKLYHTNKKLGQENSRQLDLNSSSFPDNAEEKWARQGKSIKKLKLAWMYAPDKLERWLEQMEEQGYNLYRTGWSGTVYYFIKSKPRNVKYCADFQNKTDESYFDIHRDAGWKIVFTRASFFQRWTIWSREYAEGEEESQLYSNKSDLLQNARRLAFTYSVIFVPMMILYGVSIKQHIDNVLNQGMSLNWTTVLIFGISIIIFGSFTLHTWLYYRRLRNNK